MAINEQQRDRVYKLVGSSYRRLDYVLRKKDDYDTRKELDEALTELKEAYNIVRD